MSSITLPETGSPELLRLRQATELLTEALKSMIAKIIRRELERELRKRGQQRSAGAIL